MAKKITLLMIVMLLVSALVFVSCNQDAGKKNSSTMEEREPIELESGEVGPNLVYNGSFDIPGEKESDLDPDGCSTAEIVAEKGIDGSGAYHVVTSEQYGQCDVDITKEYARGRSYYVEASFKISEANTRTDNLDASISFRVVSGSVVEHFEHDYDCDDIYAGVSGFLSDTEADEIFELTTNHLGENIADGEWHTVSGIIPATVIEDMLIEQTTDPKYGNNDPTIDSIVVTFLVGDYDASQAGYDYYLDNVVIRCLNNEIPKEGRTYRPSSGEEDGDGDSTGSAD